jgi:iron complex transport system substrate-binding protein
MKRNNSENFILEGDNLTNAVRIWERSAISLIDIRHCLISQEEPLKEYRLPVSTFLWVSGGKAEVTLNNTSYHLERFGIFHGGKGTLLSILPLCDWLEYYLVLYKEREVPFYKKELIQLIKKVNPFQLQYGFSPDNPIFFAEQFCRMYENWKTSAVLNLFYGKGALYQLVYEIFKEFESDAIRVFQPDGTAMAKRFLEEHYGEQVLMQDISHTLGISISHLRSTFKGRYGVSPQEYLNKVRIDASKEYLRSTDYRLKEIAEYVGFYDEFHMSRLFKKLTGMSPQAYKAKFTYPTGETYMENDSFLSYNEESLVRVGKLFEGEFNMLRNRKNKAMLATALSMLLLLTACGTKIPENNNTATIASPSVTSEAVDTTESTETTRIITTVKGDVEVPANPQRVIVHYLIGDASSLGIVPVGVSQVLPGAVFEESIKEATDLGSWDFELESVMALEPDLIISVNEGQYEDLSKIAPTVYVPYGTMTTEERITFLGEVLNRQEEAKQALTDYQTKVEAGRTKLKEAGLDNVSVTILQARDDGNSVAGSKHALGVIAYNELGLLPTETVQKEIIDKDEYWAAPSMEVLADYCGDYIIHLGEVPEAISSNEVWKSIPAVKDGRVVVADTALTYYTDILSSSTLVDTLVDSLIKASEGK